MTYERHNDLYVPEQFPNHDPNQPSIVLYGGGAFGIGYEAGILDELRQRGVDFSGATMLGTSAGSWVAAMMATGVEFNDVAGMDQIDLFNYEQDYLKGYAREVFGTMRADNVNATAVRFPTRQDPRFRLEILNGGEYDLADVVTPSSSVPGLWSPANVAGDRYWDGGAGGSVGYADKAPRSHTLLAVAALSQHLKVPLGPLKFPAGWALEMKSHQELGSWKRQHGGKVIYIRPNREISGLAKSTKDIFDFKLAEDVYYMAREQMAGLLADKNRSIGALALDMCQKPA